MIYLNAQDLLVRIELIEEYLSGYGNTVAKQYLYGQSNALCNFKKLALITNYLEVILCYQPITGDVTEADNCITEEQLQLILDQISLMSQISFASPGTTYIE